MRQYVSPILMSCVMMFARFLVSAPEAALKLIAFIKLTAFYKKGVEQV